MLLFSPNFCYFTETMIEMATSKLKTSFNSETSFNLKEAENRQLIEYLNRNKLHVSDALFRFNCNKFCFFIQSHYQVLSFNYISLKNLIIKNGYSKVVELCVLSKIIIKDRIFSIFIILR